MAALIRVQVAGQAPGRVVPGAKQRVWPFG
jgi:hypothetical protein